MSASLFDIVELIPVKSEPGRRMLVECELADHTALREYFVGQVEITWCSVASSVIVLNALRGDQSLDQQQFLDLAKTVVEAENVGRCGMTLQELGHALRLHGAQVQVIHAESDRLDHFRAVAVANLARPDDFIIVNYLREAIGQQQGGHFSPLAAHHAASDRFLVLDVADYKYEPVWVPAEDLWRAMSTVDGVCGRSRGYLTISLPHCPVSFPR
jgi:hypothetical protein